jgi:hypothetical protein
MWWWNLINSDNHIFITLEMSLSSYNKVHVIANDDDIESQLTNNKFSVGINISDLQVTKDDVDFRGNIRVISN